MKKTNANAIVIGEGERTIVDLLDAFENNGDLFYVKGISFMNKDVCVITSSRELIRDLSAITYPAWDLFPMDYYALYRRVIHNNTDRCGFIITSRGCPFRCNFCYRMDEGIRLRLIPDVIEEIKILKERYRVNYIWFIDELFMASRKRTIDMCQAIIDADLNIKWDCNGRLNYADSETIGIMKKAGCVYINYGIESLSNETLEVMNKKLDIDTIIKGIEATLEHGISPGFNIIFGNIDETAETLQNGVDFLLKYDDHSQLRTIRPVTPYPGSDLYYYAIKKGLLKDVSDFYENKHINSDLLAINFTQNSDDEVHQLLCNANLQLIDAYLDARREEYEETLKKVYLDLDETFRGFRKV